MPLLGVYRAGQILERLMRRDIYTLLGKYNKCFTSTQISEYSKLKSSLKKIVKDQSTDYLRIRLE
jgi:hypothetical protein